MIRNAQVEDGPRIAEIYNEYVLNSCITFEMEQVSGSNMQQRIEAGLNAGFPWLVFESAAGIVTGYAYASPWKSRRAYQYSVESTVYIDKENHGKGIGKQLVIALFNQLTLQGVHTVVSGIALPNAASIALHESLGMSKVAHFKEVGFKFNQWLDVGYWQKTLGDSV